MHSTAAPKLLKPIVAWTYLAGATLISLIYAAGLLDDSVYLLMLAGTCVSIPLGLRRNRPAQRWQWWAVVVAALFAMTAGIVRQNVNATGVLTADRSLLPDVFAIPTYLFLGSALAGLRPARRTQHRDRSAWLDGAIVSLGALLLAWVFAIGPTLSDTTAWLPAQVAIAIYPPMSATLVTIACSLAFGSDRRSPSHHMVFAGSVCMLVGDITFAMAEAGTLSFGRLYELPFLMSSALFAAAALHPSMRHLNRPATRRPGKLTTSRAVMLGVTLLLPGGVAVAAPHASGGAKWFLVANLCLLGIAAAARLLATVREQALSEIRLAHQATHDELTGLPNRTLALSHIEELLRRNEHAGTTLGVFFLDIDQFKLINDSMGHAVGDGLLVKAAERLTGSVRAHDMVARISGDEFLIICDNLTPRSAIDIAERMRTTFNAAFELPAGKVFVTVSVGVALADPDGRCDAASLVRDADTAMYRSKATGRDTVTFFGVEMRERVERRVELERLMRIGLDDGEFVAHFQPIVTFPDGQVEGFEALARWPRATGPIFPDEFIPVAEESGLIVQLGARILDEACRQLSVWRHTIPGAEHLYVSVNLSPRQVLDPDIVDTVADTLARWDLPGSALWLEITESVMMEDTVETQAVLNALCGLGLSLSVDDFGTGFSSLSYLRRYPVSKVKIDKSFVDGLDKPDADHSLVEAIIAMAAALNLDSVAEGVETVEQANLLFELGCTNGQGYYYARPTAAQDVPIVIAGLNGAALAVETVRD